MDKTTLCWVFGKLGSGKTSYVLYNEKASNAKALYIGRECRKKFGPENMAKDINPIAPESTEKFVRQLVIDKVQNTNPGEVLFIDGMPRKPSQVRWIRENFDKPGIDNIIMLFTCDDETRIKRVKKRDENDADSIELDNARFNMEDKSILRVVEEILILSHSFGSLTFVCYDNTEEDALFKEDTDIGRKSFSDTYEKDDIESVVFADTNLGRMFYRLSVFADTVYAKKGMSVTTKKLYNATEKLDTCENMAESVVWVKRFIHAAMEELKELDTELKDCWWSNDMTNLRAARVELVDAWHFLISASLALGMDATMFTKTFYQKLEINIKRQKGNYIKNNKDRGDDSHIGKSLTN